MAALRRLNVKDIKVKRQMDIEKDQCEMLLKHIESFSGYGKLSLTDLKSAHDYIKKQYNLQQW